MTAGTPSTVPASLSTFGRLNCARVLLGLGKIWCEWPMSIASMPGTWARCHAWFSMVGVYGESSRPPWMMATTSSAPLARQIVHQRGRDLLHPLREDLAVEPFLVPAQDRRRREVDEADLDRALDGAAARRRRLDGLLDEDGVREERLVRLQAEDVGVHQREPRAPAVRRASDIEPLDVERGVGHLREKGEAEVEFVIADPADVETPGGSSPCTWPASRRTRSARRAPDSRRGRCPGSCRRCRSGSCSRTRPAPG